MFFTLLLVFQFPFASSATSQVFQNNKTSDQIKVYNHILISRQESYPGHHLCHDGEFLSFKNQELCQISRGPECASLKITPLAEIEDIYLSQKKIEKVTRFYSIPLQYQVSFFEKNKDSEWSYTLVEETEFKVPTCDGQAVEDTRITYLERVARDTREQRVLHAIHAGGFTLINSPKGLIHDLTYVESQSPLLDWDKIHYNFKKNITSPECHSAVDDDILALLSGELSGNGVSAELLFKAQSLSQPLKDAGAGDSNESKIKCDEAPWI